MPEYRDPGAVEFDAPIQRYDGGGSFVTFPFDVTAIFGVKGRVPVRASYDGADYRGSLSKYGAHHMLVVPLELQDRIDKHHGDTVHVSLRLDTAERVVELDAATEESFGAAGVLETFRALSYSRQREFWQWIDSAKRPQTRSDRVAKAVELIRDGAPLR